MNTLSLLVFGPAILGLLLLFLPERFGKAGKSIAFLGGVAFFVGDLSVSALSAPDSGALAREDSVKIPLRLTIAPVIRR